MSARHTPTPPTPAPRREYASIAQAAEYLGVGRVLIRRWVTEGRLTGYRMPGSRVIRVDLAELDARMGGDAA